MSPSQDAKAAVPNAAAAPVAHPISIDDIYRAREILREVVARTPMRQSLAAPAWLAAPAGTAGSAGEAATEIFFKLENEQRTGSFKIRGAVNKMARLTAEERKRGVVASSAGNHAQGVAYAAQQLGVKATIVMPATAAIVKIIATRGYGANVVLHGEFYDEAYAKALELEKEKGLVFVHPFQDPLIMAGQGTIGLEIVEDLPDLDSVVVPIGGGGLISGVATAIKALRPSVRVIGVTSDQAPGMMHLKNGTQPGPSRRKISTIADGIAVKSPSPIVFENYISRLVDEVVAVSDDEIAQAITFLLEKTKTVTEGSGAAGLAAAFSRPLRLGKKCCVLLCGGNIDLNVMARVIERGLRRQHRLARIAVVADDLPGNLSRLTAILTEKRSNVLEVLHDRVSPELGLRETRIDLLVETSSDEHIAEILGALKGEGFRIVSSPLPIP
jgi:threonine dehydratase